MQVNSISAANTVNSTSFGSKPKDKCCPEAASKNSSFVTVPRVVYTALLAAVLGGPLTSCEPDEIKPDPVPPTPPVVPPVVPGDTVTQSPVQKSLVNMLQSLGLMSVTKSTSSASLKKGDVVEMSFFDVYNDAKTEMKINEAESSKDAMVYYGVQTYADDGSKTNLRYTLSENGSALSLKKEVMVNGKYAPRQTYEFVKNPDGTVDQRQVLQDGTREPICTYKPDSMESLIRVNDDGSEDLIDDISIVQKQ